MVVICVMGCAVLAGASVKSDIEQQYKAWVRSSLKLDVDGVLAVLTPEYTLKTFDGKVIPLKNYEVSLRQRKAKGIKPANYTTEIKSLEEAGDEAKVISLETSITDTPDPITNKVQKVIHIHEYLDTWKRMGRKWRLASTVTQVERTTIDHSSGS
jgi:hypothetical protein